MIVEQRFKDALLDVEGEVRGGLSMDDAINLMATEAELPPQGLKRWAEKAWGDLEFKQRQLRQASANTKREDEVRSEAFGYVRKLLDGSAPPPGRVKVVPIVALHSWVNRNFADERERRIAFKAGLTQLETSKEQTNIA